jgi:hypothetical protein
MLRKAKKDQDDFGKLYERIVAVKLQDVAIRKHGAP